MTTKIMQREMMAMRALLERTLANISVQHFYGAAQRERVMETTRNDIRSVMSAIQKWGEDITPVAAIEHTRRHVDAIANYRAPVTPTADRPVNPELAWEPDDSASIYARPCSCSPGEVCNLCHPPYDHPAGWNDHPKTL